MDALRNTIIFSLMILISACGVKVNKTTQETRLPAVAGPTEIPTFLSGEFSIDESNKINLENFNNQSVLLVFGTDLCTTCAEEAEDLRKSYLDEMSHLNQIKIFTVLVGAFPEDVEFWVNLHQIPWQVGTDLESVLFQSYCAKDVVPCLVLQDEKKGILWVKQEKVSVDQILSDLGK